MRLILFDIDGTLIDGGGAGRRALEAAFAEVFDLAELPDVAGRVSFNGALDPAIHTAMAALLGIAPAHLAEREDALERSYLRQLQRLASSKPARVLPGVHAVLGRLSVAAGIGLGLATGNIEAGARIKLEPPGLNRHFATGAFGRDATTRAELAAVGRRRLEILCGRPVPARSVTIVGDSTRDVESARANGFRALAVATGWTSAADLAVAGAHRVLADLSDVAAVFDWLSG